MPKKKTYICYINVTMTRNMYIYGRNAYKQFGFQWSSTSTNTRLVQAATKLKYHSTTAFLPEASKHLAFVIILLKS